MNPIKTKESNFVYLGPAEVHDLHCRTEGAYAYSVWRLTDEERRQIAAGANIRLGINARPIPPVSLQVVADAGEFERVPAPCDVCQRESDDPVHDSGEGTHAYRHRRPEPATGEAPPHSGPLRSHRP